MCKFFLEVVVVQSNPLPIILLLIFIGIVWFVIHIIKKSKKNRISSDYVLSDVEKLKDMLENGEITKNEYDKRKRNMINKL